LLVGADLGNITTVNIRYGSVTLSVNVKLAPAKPEYAGKGAQALGRKHLLGSPLKETSGLMQNHA